MNLLRGIMGSSVSDGGGDILIHERGLMVSSVSGGEEERESSSAVVEDRQ